MKRTRNLLLLTLLFVLLIIVTSGCVAPASPSPAAGTTPVLTPVKVAYMPITSFGPIFIAKDEGYFAQEGLDVELVRFSSTSEALPLILKGEIAVSGGNLYPGLINAAAGGAHIRFVADKGSILENSCDSQAFIVRRDLVDSGAVRTMADLRGGTVAAGTDQTYALRRALAAGNLTTDDVHLEDMQRPAIVTALQNKAIDGAFLMEPYLSHAIKSNSSVVLLNGYAFTPNLSSPLIYGPAFTDGSPDLGRRFMAAYLQGVRQYNQGKTARNLAILSNYTQIDPDDLNQTCWVDIAADGGFLVPPLQEYVNWTYKNKQISNNLSVDQMVDMEYVRYARSVTGNGSAEPVQHP